jgi:hypothetical protein
VDINHPDQYYTITKEKGKNTDQYYTITKEKGKNTESNEYRVTFNELNVHSVPDILKTLQNLFDSILTDVTKGIQEEDFVQITLECPDLDFPIILPLMQMNQLTSELLLTEIERVLQSNEQFILDHCVQLNITHVSLPKGGTGKRCDYVDTERFLKDKRCIIQIQNTDDMCCARAIVTAKAKIDGHEQWNFIRQRRRIQEEMLELHAKAGVPLHQCGIEDVKTFQRFLIRYQIHVERAFQRHRLPWTHSREEDLLVLS